MNSTRNKRPGIPQPFKQPQGHAHQTKPHVAQLKRGIAPPARGISPPAIKHPVAPPVHRIQATTKTVQPNTANGVVNPNHIAPTRPQPPPQVLQKKSPPVQPPRPGQAPRQPFASLVHAQKQPNLIQPKTNFRSPFAATDRPVVQAKPATPVRFLAPASKVVQPAIGHLAGTGSVIQQGKPKGLKKAPQKKAVVTLTVGSKDYTGVSSGQYGHAEMQALRKFITFYDTMADASRALNNASKLKVKCPNQAVCGSCTIILEALGFEARLGTTFSTTKSGGVSWGANMKVREFLEFRGLEDDYQRAVRAGAK